MILNINNNFMKKILKNEKFTDKKPLLKKLSNLIV